jgi:hypothetical protein
MQSIVAYGQDNSQQHYAPVSKPPPGSDILPDGERVFSMDFVVEKSRIASSIVAFTASSIRIRELQRSKTFSRNEMTK